MQVRSSTGKENTTTMRIADFFFFLIYGDPFEPQYDEYKGDFVVEFFSLSGAASFVSAPWASLNTAIFLKKNGRNSRFMYVCLKHPGAKACVFSKHLSKASATYTPCLVTLGVPQITTHPSALESRLGREFTLHTWYMCESWGNFGTLFPINF